MKSLEIQGSLLGWVGLSILKKIFYLNYKSIKPTKNLWMNVYVFKKKCKSNLVDPSSYINCPNDKLDKLVFHSLRIPFLLYVFSF